MEMTKLVGLYKESDQSQKAFAASHGINEGKLHYWITKLSSSNKILPKVNQPSFVPIEITPLLLAKTDQAILIRLKSGVEIEIPV